ncbi:hypothetical protein Gbem_4143 [Citrifermentans bemidjiense Bem]|uniref:Transmembrane protein n=1 Tax=Citrifermentans bemidjiense (strain ATCC BAA-1014 / DSM 16622 / JCM 12645 / Bem) TaxID=404380 RepID=E1P6E8_CITBB|nr:hypothetical protein [Citrifermentans bemidjiense]ADO00843.1 hypothetical protein Gbem_4143 [Citrifermentans bemidjiense Bem]HBB70644.1 hypothetical protein [Geobacter sulfurreducens]
MENGSELSRSSQWWRWPILPLAAVLGALVGAFLLTLLQWIGMKMQGGFREDGWYFRYILPVISSAVFGWLYALITLNVAPRGKVIASVVMTTILGVLALLGLIFTWFYKLDDIGTAVQSTVGSIASLVAAIATIVSLKDEYTE